MAVSLGMKSTAKTRWPSLSPFAGGVKLFNDAAVRFVTDGSSFGHKIFALNFKDVDMGTYAARGRDNAYQHIYRTCVRKRYLTESNAVFSINVPLLLFGLEL